MAGKGKIKGITIEFAADSSELTKALKDADKAASQAQKSLREIDKALKLDPGNITLLKQKQEELKKAIDATTKELDGFKTELAAMDAAGVEKTDERYMALQRNIMKCENDLKGFNAELRNVNAQASNLGQLSTKFGEIGSKCSELGRNMAAVSAAAAGVVTAIGAVTYSTAVWADDLNTLSKVTGISTDKLQIYSAAADLVDVEVSTIAKSVARMKKNMLSASEGTGTAAEAFDALGISVVDANGNLRDQDSVFQEVIARLGEMENETERDAYAMSIFGKSATELNPLIEDCGETYKNVADIFAQNGLEVIDQETLDKANDFNDAVDEMKLNLFQAKTILGARLGEAFGKDIKNISKWIGELSGKIANMNPNILKVITIIAGVVAVVSPLLIILGAVISSVGTIIGVIAKIGPLIGTITTAVKGLWALLAANPIILIAAAIAALIVAMVKAYQEGGKFRDICDKIWSVIKNLGSAVKDFATNAINKLKNAFSDIKNIGKNIVTGLWNGISDKFSWLVGKIKEFAGNVKNKLKSFFGIKSPSKWARDVIGSNIAAGIGVGFQESMASVSSDMKSTINASKATLAGGQTTLADQLSNAVGTGLALQNSGPSTVTNQPIVIEMGGTKVAEVIYKLNKQGAMALQG